MEKTKEINQENVCGYCSNKIIGEECGTLTLKDKDGKWGERKPNQSIWNNMINPFNCNDINTWKGRY